MAPETLAERFERLSRMAEEQGDYKGAAKLAQQAHHALRIAQTEQEGEGTGLGGVVNLFDLVDGAFPDVAQEEE